MSNSQQFSAIVRCPTFDADGYPTEETKLAIKTWDFRDAPGWLTYIREAWNHHYGRMWEEGGLLKLATGGWSGNEAITHAMRENYALWGLLWESSHRGGLEVLKMPVHPTAAERDVDNRKENQDTVTVHSTAEIKHGLCMSALAADASSAGSQVPAPPDHFVCAGCGETSGEWGHYITEECLAGPEDSRADMIGEYECNHCGSQDWVDPTNTKDQAPTE